MYPWTCTEGDSVIACRKDLDCLRGTLEPGHAVLTRVAPASYRAGTEVVGAGQQGLSVHYVAHAVEPDWRTTDGTDGLKAIQWSYDAAARLLHHEGARRVAASLLGAGEQRRAGLPKICTAAVIALQAHLTEGDTSLQEVHLVAYSPAERQALLDVAEWAGGQQVTGPLPALPPLTGTGSGPGPQPRPQPRPQPAPPTAPSTISDRAVPPPSSG